MIFLKKNTEEVTLLYTSDIHGHASPLLYGTNEEADLGLAKYATVVKQAKDKYKSLIVLDNGDLIQGTPFMSHYVKEYSNKENPMIGIMNQIGIDTAVLGNHEFNFGKRILSDAIEQSNFPWISANVLDENTGEPAFGPPYIIKTVENGVKIAIVGVTTHYIPHWESPSHIKGIGFTDAFSTLKKWVQHIHQTENPDILIASYHGGFERDLETGEPTEQLTGENQGYQMCMQIEGIDVLLTGHQHRNLTDMINNVLVIQTGNNGQRYGEIQFVLEKNHDQWQIRNKKALLHTLEGVKSDSEVMNYIGDLEASTQKWLDQPVGYIEGNMLITDPFEARMRKHPFIQFIQDIQMEASGVDISVTPLLNNSSQGFNSIVTMRDVVSNYMYPNTLIVLELTGLDIIAALEKSAEYFILDEQANIAVNPTYIEPKPQHYNYDMWEGIEYTINVAKPVGSRIEDISYQGSNLEKNKTYHVVFNNYRASGGGDFGMLQGKKVIKEIQRDPVELIQTYFEKHKTVQATTVDNFIVKTEE